ncbi:hypothetical protein P7K49_014153 [Saguinus oedipus]|uniref:Uncharacterized protein n=1 Tax=Saguinus oedipus TaxID=9490 RepID=A0ABQ9VI13_SAGOE|nr:hypothetical protein P7K49_014153 [Saguinus oedipus]
MVEEAGQGCQKYLDKDLFVICSLYSLSQSPGTAGRIVCRSLSIDYVENKLYWISSGNGTINRCNLDGGNLEVIESMKEELTKATALTIMVNTKLTELNAINTVSKNGADTQRTPVVTSGFVIIYAGNIELLRKGLS